jgi:peptidylprolyl isomerase
MTQQAGAGDTVRIHYTGTLADGSEFDSSRGRPPLEFTVGSGQVIPGFDRAVAGMRVGDARTVTIPAAEAYGAHDPALVREVPRAQLPPPIEPAVGMQLQVRGGGGPMVVTVRAVSERAVVLDGNHPLAGQDLTFALELVAIA